MVEVSFLFCLGDGISIQKDERCNIDNKSVKHDLVLLMLQKCDQPVDTVDGF